MPQTAVQWTESNDVLDNALCNFVDLKTDYFSYIPTPLDVSKPIFEPQVQQTKTQIRQLSETTSSSQFSGENYGSPDTSVSYCTVSAEESSLNPLHLLLQTWPSTSNTISNSDQPIQPAQSPESLSNPTSILPHFPEPATRKTRRKYRKRKILSQAVIEQKREKFLERNRVAANRYREKKKEWVTELEEKQMELKNANLRLLEEQESLRAEIRKLQGLLRQCTSCKGRTLDGVSKEKPG